jgi:hypothetical protein
MDNTQYVNLNEIKIDGMTNNLNDDNFDKTIIINEKNIIYLIILVIFIIIFILPSILINTY